MRCSSRWWAALRVALCLLAVLLPSIVTATPKGGVPMASAGGGNPAGGGAGSIPTRLVPPPNP